MVKDTLCWSCANATSALRCQWAVGIERKDWTVTRGKNRLCVKACAGYKCGWKRTSISELSRILRTVSASGLAKWNDDRLIDELLKCGFKAKICMSSKKSRIIYTHKIEKASEKYLTSVAN